MARILSSGEVTCWIEEDLVTPPGLVQSFMSYAFYSFWMILADNPYITECQRRLKHRKRPHEDFPRVYQQSLSPRFHLSNDERYKLDASNAKTPNSSKRKLHRQRIKFDWKKIHRFQPKIMAIDSPLSQKIFPTMYPSPKSISPYIDQVLHFVCLYLSSSLDLVPFSSWLLDCDHCIRIVIVDLAVRF